MDKKNNHMVPMELLTRVLASEASQEDRHALDQWLSQSEQNKKEFAAIEKLWGLTDNDVLATELDIDAEWKSLDAKISPKGKVIRLSHLIRIAASIILVLGLAYLGMEQFSYKTIRTDLARMDNIELPDGSIISLNANSSIKYARNFEKKSRNIALKGEGFFDVAPDKNRPFIINAGDATIQVVGTQFNVKAYREDDQITVSVVEGKVDLYNRIAPSEVVRIEAGESARFVKQKKQIEKTDSLNSNDFSWKTLDISFENSTLEEVVAVLENTYHYEFTLSENLKDCTITVEFKDQKLNAVLKVLKSTLNLEMEQKGRTILISGEGCIK